MYRMNDTHFYFATEKYVAHPGSSAPSESQTKLGYTYA